MGIIWHGVVVYIMGFLCHAHALYIVGIICPVFHVLCIMWVLYGLYMSFHLVLWFLSLVKSVVFFPGSYIIPILYGLYMAHHHQSPTPDKISYTKHKKLV